MVISQPSYHQSELKFPTSLKFGPFTACAKYIYIFFSSDQFPGPIQRREPWHPRPSNPTFKWMSLCWELDAVTLKLKQALDFTYVQEEFASFPWALMVTGLANSTYWRSLQHWLKKRSDSLLYWFYYPQMAQAWKKMGFISFCSQG